MGFCDTAHHANKAATTGPTPVLKTLIMLHTSHTHTTCSLTKPATRVAPHCEHAYKEDPMTEPRQLLNELTMAAQTALIYLIWNSIKAISLYPLCFQ